MQAPRKTWALRARYSYIYDRKEQAGHTVDGTSPAIWTSPVHADKDSMFNTPPVFAIYTSMLTLRWLKAEGGVNAMHRERNAAKAGLHLRRDRPQPPLQWLCCRPDSRSVMNATFTPAQDEAHTALSSSPLAKPRESTALKGHRSIGGGSGPPCTTPSPCPAWKALAEVMRDFERTHG